MYFNKYIRGVGAEEEAAAGGPLRLLGGRGAARPPPIEVAADMTDDLLEDAAQQTEGFSGRELAKLVTGVQAVVYGSHERRLDGATFRAIIAYKAKEHAHRMELVKAGGHPRPAELVPGAKPGGSER